MDEMDPDGTIYFLISTAINFILCLYIAAVRRQEEYEDYAIGVSKSLISSALLFMVNFGVLVYFILPKFDVVWQCVMGALFVFIGTLLPYCIGLAQYDKLEKLVKLLSPIMVILNYTLPVVAIFKIFKLDTQTKVTQKDVMDLVEDAEDDIIDDEQKEMIENIFELDGTTVGEIMTHRTEVFAVSEDATCLDILDQTKEEGFSRIPVYSGTIDTISGVLYAKDLLAVIGDQSLLNAPVKTFARKPMFVPESCHANDLLVQFKVKRMQMAVVVDEYGGTSGIITMEDILEEIVGNIQDEYDNEEEEYHSVDENTIVCKASFDIDDAFDSLGLDLPEDLEEDFDTVGGLIIDRLARIPEQTERAQVEYRGVLFTVLEVADRRIVKVQAEKITGEEEQKTSVTKG
ncbi:MAG: hemolysin family protein [Oscillospiraceae bacterium]